MKNFMFIFRGGLDPQTASPEEMQQNMEKWLEWVASLQANGSYIAGEALMPSGKTLHKGNLITDGPFVESKEIVGGFFIVAAASIEEATEMAKGSPDLSLGGSVEIRDVVVFE
jgi:hypothetical protein